MSWYSDQQKFFFQSFTNKLFCFYYNLEKKSKKFSIPNMYARKIFRKTNMSYTLIRTSTCAIQEMVKSANFSEDFT